MALNITNVAKYEKKKEYLVQITVIEARHLADKDDGSSNPFVKMKIPGLQTQATQVQKRTLSPVWNQSFTFSGLELSDTELQNTELMFEVVSRNSFFSNDLIGKYAINLSTLYKNANHEYYNVWLCLTNPDYEGEDDDTQGYLLVDCFIISEGDRPPVHSVNDKLNADVEEEDEELNIDSMNFEELRAYQEKKQGIQILGKPSVARKAFQLSAFVFKAEGLCDFPGVFGMKKPSFFVSCRSMGLVQRTTIVNDNSAPLINKKMLFPTFFPFLNDKILMRAWSYTKGGADKFIANIPEFPAANDIFNISKIMSLGGKIGAKWINLYGIPPTERNDYVSGGKRKHPAHGTAYLGRLLLSFNLTPNPKPTVHILPCNPFIDPENLTYRLFCDVYQIKFIKDYDILVWVDVTIGSYSTGNSKKKKPNEKKHSIEWKIEDNKNEVCLPAIVQNFPKDINSVPDIFINLYTGNGSTEERIGYIRLNAEEVNSWDPLPRWLHFNSLDTKKDSPGSLLTNLQFMVDNENIKRIVKQKGITSNFILYAHIVNGFEIDSRDTCDSDIETYVEIDIDGKTKTTPYKKGHFPFWNSLVEIPIELDAKLDFAPDILVKLVKKTSKGFFRNNDTEIIGQFTVPMWCCKKKKTYPHYFNFIRNNDTIGRLMAMFFIDPQNKKKHVETAFPIYESLKNSRTANVNISILGLRELDFETTVGNSDFTVSICQDNTDSDTKDINENKEIFSKINNSDSKENFLNLIKVHEFSDIKIYGDKDFQIYPIVKIEYIKKSFFGNDSRFLIFNLSDYSNTISEKDKKKQRLLFECNLGNNSIDQKQYILHEINEIVFENKEEKDYLDEDEEDEINIVPSSNDAKNKIKEIFEDDEDAIDANIDLKMVTSITHYKNCEISEEINLECMPEDKCKEKEIKRNLRRQIFLEMKSLKFKNNLDAESTEKLLDLNKKYRELKKPLINEDIFYGFDDLADEYDYGRDVYKEDVYETHTDLKIPYNSSKLYKIPNGIFSSKFEKMEGYYKRGNITNCILKYKVEIIIDNMNKSEEIELEKIKKKEEKNEKKHNKNRKIETQLEKEEEELKTELKEYNVFNNFYINRLINCYTNKKLRKDLKKDQICFPMNNIKVRVYVLRALNLSAQDNYSTVENAMSGYKAYCRANSYLELKLGHKYDSSDSKQLKYINDSINYIKDTLNPNFYKYFELEGDLPQDWKLTINVKSKNENTIGADSLIGSTTIDLEDRYLGDYKNQMTLSYKAYEDYLNKEIEKDVSDIIPKKLTAISSKLDDLKSKVVPVEFRPIYLPDKRTAQGVLEMFVEVLSNQQSKVVPPAKIEPPAPEEFELRVVIWECRNLAMDKKKALSVYINCAYKPEGWLSNVSYTNYFLN